MPADVRQGRIAAPGALEFIPRGVRWPEGLDGAYPSEVCNSREIDYQQRLMLWIDTLFEALGQKQSSLGFAAAATAFRYWKFFGIGFCSNLPKSSNAWLPPAPWRRKAPSESAGSSPKTTRLR